VVAVTACAALVAYAIGVGLSLALLVFATVVGLDRSRGFYPTVLIVIASYYCLFAVMGGSIAALVSESVVVGGFVVLSVCGFRLSLWLIVSGLIAHGALDLVHGRLIHNPGVPPWWPMFCCTFDVTMGMYLAGRLGRGSFITAALES
jgi:hypothetical protein